MRYWAFFAGKLIAVAAIADGLFKMLDWLWPAQQFAYPYPPGFGHELGYTLGVGAWFLLCCGLVYAAVWDQRYRCRTCACGGCACPSRPDPGAACCSSAGRKSNTSAPTATAA